MFLIVFCVNHILNNIKFVNKKYSDYFLVLSFIIRQKCVSESTFKASDSQWWTNSGDACKSNIFQQ